MKTSVRRSPREYLRLFVAHTVIMAIYQTIRALYRVMYGFRLRGAERIPQDGPAIILPSDSQSLGGVLAQGVANIGLLQPFFGRESVVCFMNEQLVATIFSRFPQRMRTYGLRPHGSGTLALSLIDAYRELRRGGIAIIAPEGDACWDGKTVSVRDGCAWLGLRTAAPLIPLIPTAGCYDVWPFWQARPNLSGRMDLIIGEPFHLSETPLETVSEDDLARARGVIQEKIDALRYGPEGVAGWQEQPRLRGKLLDAPPAVRLRAPTADWKPKPAPIKRKGMAILLFQCPICGASDGLVHRPRPFGNDRLYCRACSAAWSVRRRPGKDYMLTLTDGPEEIVGLEMALSQWYTGLKQDLCLTPLTGGHDMAAADGEEPLLAASDVRLTAHEASLAPSLRGAITAPTTHSGPHLALPEKGVVGMGQLLMTDQRLVWGSNGSQVSFEWESIRAVHLTFRNVLTIAHGAAWYTFHLGDESAIKWVAYADRVLDRVALAGHPKATISPY